MEFLRFLEGIRTPFFDKIFQVITYLGQELVATAVICIFFWCVNKSFGYKIGFSFFAAGLALQALKITFRIDRPWVIAEREGYEFTIVESARSAATGYSFPSGHTQCAATVFTSLAIFFKKWWAKILCVLAFLLVGFSRMYLGVHTPKDVIVGIALGLSGIIVFNYLMDKIENNKSYDVIIMIAMCLVSVGVAVYSIIMKSTGKITDIKYVFDCCKAAGAGLGFAIGWFVERKFIDFSVKTPRLWMQFCKVAVGLGGALVLKEIPKRIAGETIATDIIRYMLVTFWCAAVFPFLCKKVMEKISPKFNKDGESAE